VLDAEQVERAERPARRAAIWNLAVAHLVNDSKRFGRRYLGVFPDFNLGKVLVLLPFPGADASCRNPAGSE
jgi:hypothetical protein